MKVHNVTQGSPEWHALRAAHFCASDAPAMLGLSKYKSRDALLREKASGLTPEVDAATQILFNRGHEAEEKARAIAERIVGEDLYPAVGTDVIDGLPLLASFDGLTMDDSVSFEHKLYAEWLLEFIKTGDLPDTHWPQVEHQMLLSGSARTLFMTSDGTEERFGYVWYESRADRRATVLAGWRQFAEDLASYVVTDKAASPVAAPIEALPAVVVQVQGSLAVSDNLKTFGERLRVFIDGINKKPETDQDFANAEAAIKALSKAEDALQQAKASALEQVSSVAEMQRAVDLHYDLARTTRLALEKLVKAEKENRRTKIVMDSQEALRAHIDSLNATIGKPYMPVIAADFNGAIKGLKSIDSIKNAADTELAKAKIAAGEAFARIQQNLASLRELAAGHAFLFADTATLVLKPNDDLVTLIKARIAEHAAAEAKRLEEEREKIRAEEQARAENEAKAKVEAAAPAPVAAPVQDLMFKVEPKQLPAASDTGERITLGNINSRLAPISVTKDGLLQIGIEPAGKDRAAVLYREVDFPKICAALIQVINAAAMKVEA